MKALLTFALLCATIPTVAMRLPLKREEGTRHMTTQLSLDLPTLRGSSDSPSGDACPPVSAEGGLSFKTSQKDRDRAREWRKNNPDRVKSNSATYYKKNQKELIKKSDKWGKENPEKRRAISLKYFRSHKDEYAERQRKWIANNREESNARARARYAKNHDHMRAKARSFHHRNKKKSNAASKKWRTDNPEKARAAVVAWNLANPKKLKACAKSWLHSDKPRAIDARLARGLRIRMINALNGKNKSKSTQALIGCTWTELRAYLESLFKDGMTWENRGRHGWHVDHIRPCCSFDLSDPEQQQECFHYSNLQPLWAHENLAKSGKYTP